MDQDVLEGSRKASALDKRRANLRYAVDAVPGPGPNPICHRVVLVSVGDRVDHCRQVTRLQAVKKGEAGDLSQGYIVEVLRGPRLSWHGDQDLLLNDVVSDADPVAEQQMLDVSESAWRAVARPAGRIGKVIRVEGLQRVDD